jgi:hypothetical protein
VYPLLLLKFTLSPFDPASASGSDGLSAFTGMVDYGVRRWTPVCRCLHTKKPDFAEARRLLGASPVLELGNGNPWSYSFESKLQVAVDSIDFGRGTDEDALTVALASVRQRLYQAEEHARSLVEGVCGDDENRLSLAKRGETARTKAETARSAWGRRRLLERADHWDAHAAELADSRKEKVRRARTGAKAFLHECEKILKVIDNWRNQSAASQ